MTPPVDSNKDEYMGVDFAHSQDPSILPPVDSKGAGKSKEITIKLPQGWNDNHIQHLAEKIMGGCVGLLVPYDKTRFELLQHRIESVIYNYIEESAPRKANK